MPEKINTTDIDKYLFSNTDQEKKLREIKIINIKIPQTLKNYIVYNCMPINFKIYVKYID